MPEPGEGKPIAEADEESILGPKKDDELLQGVNGEDRLLLGTED